jgi:hypothetical protein
MDSSEATLPRNEDGSYSSSSSRLVDDDVVQVGKLYAGVRQALLLVDVALRRCEEGQEVDCADGGEQPVEVVEPAVVEVVGEPGAPAAGGGDGVHDADEGGAEEEAKGERAEEEARAHGLHALGALAQEEVELADVGEGLAGADEEELRREQEHR